MPVFNSELLLQKNPNKPKSPFVVGLCLSRECKSTFGSFLHLIYSLLLKTFVLRAFNQLVGNGHFGRATNRKVN